MGRRSNELIHIRWCHSSGCCQLSLSVPNGHRLQLGRRLQSMNQKTFFLPPAVVRLRFGTTVAFIRLNKRRSCLRKNGSTKFNLCAGFCYKQPDCLPRIDNWNLVKKSEISSLTWTALVNNTINFLIFSNWSDNIFHQTDLVEPDHLDRWL